MDKNTPQIATGTEVTWAVSSTRPGVVTYSGRILAFIPKGLDIGDFKNTYHGRSLLALKWANPPTRVARMDRYVVETTEGCRTVTARRLETVAEMPNCGHRLHPNTLPGGRSCCEEAAERRCRTRSPGVRR